MVSKWNFAKEVKEEAGNLLLYGFLLCGAGAILSSCRSSWSENLDVNHYRNVKYDSQGADIYNGIRIHVTDRENKRFVTFRDLDLDGSLDEVIIRNDFQAHSITNLDELKEWEEDYESAKKRYVGVIGI